jgi:archaeosine-15-forming tRNA-guanine transglycosylase
VHQLRAGSDSTKIQLNQSLRMRKVNFEGKKLNSLESFDGMLLLSENHLQHLQKIAVAAAAAVVAKSVGAAAAAAAADDDYDEDLLLLFLHVS